MVFQTTSTCTTTSYNTEREKVAAAKAEADAAQSQVRSLKRELDKAGEKAKKHTRDEQVLLSNLKVGNGGG